jgi:hypothetical protein
MIKVTFNIIYYNYIAKKLSLKKSEELFSESKLTILTDENVRGNTGKNALYVINRLKLKNKQTNK